MKMMWKNNPKREILISFEKQWSSAASKISTIAKDTPLNLLLYIFLSLFLAFWGGESLKIPSSIFFPTLNVSNW